MLIAPSQDFGANCKLPIVMLGLVVSVSQHLITLRIRIAAFIGTRHSLVRWKNVWETVAKYVLLSCFVLERRPLTLAIQHCPEPRNAEEHDLQDEEDKSYVRGRIAYVML